MKKRFSLCALLLALLLALSPAAARAATPAPGQVVISPQHLTVDGVERAVQKYNIDGSNYFKLRDIAYLLNGTESQFAVGWDAATSTVSITTGQAYEPNGSELLVGADRSSTAVPSSQAILIDGVRRGDLYVYNIDNANYFKLRDLGTALGFGVDFDIPANTAIVTSKGYSSDVPEPEVSADMQLTVAGETYALGMSADALTALAGQPSETLSSTAGYTWYVFGTNTYLDFLLAGVDGGKVVVLVSGGKAFSYLGNTAGAKNVSISNSYAKLYTDKNDGGILHAVMLRDANASHGTVTTVEALRGESIVNFHMTNAFRVYHGLKPFRWSEAAAEASRLHSQDMADQNYFEHNSLDGRSPWARMEAQGIRWSNAAENISAGRSNGVDSYDGWVNSSGHRQNMLGDCEELGVGAAYNAGSSYRWYMTQDFFTTRNW